ncbi:MAG: serine/threonine protein kinase, partial [Bryobacteraceae bacterium]|nr:serine/threonine protein kinase [Bryobacteraceae bacterium]
MSQPRRTMGELLQLAIEQPPGQREGWLRRTCGDPAVLPEALDLLRQYEADPAFLEHGLPESEPLIGQYRIVREAGRGGMGVVYEAIQHSGALDRRVALKVIRPVWAGAQILERFQREQQLLARLEHPGIARLYECGSAPDGSHFFAMEFVDGCPIDEWCDREALSTAQRVRLVLQVCDAVSYAHRQLIVHRDLKPSNVLVDSTGRARLLDFGVAKL